MIRSTSHSISFANTGKKEQYWAFLKEYRSVAAQMVDQIWSGWGDFDVKTDKLDFPQYLDYKSFKLNTKLSARVLSSLSTQVSGVIRSATEKRRRLLWGREKMRSENKPLSNIEKKINKCKLVKPGAI